MNFGGDEVVCDYFTSQVIIVPVPYDDTSTWIRGADKGPEALLNASANLEFYDPETGKEAFLNGIHTLEPICGKNSPEALVNAVSQTIGSILSDKKFPVIIGGNHTVTIGSVMAFSEYFDDLTVLQLDAHADMRQAYNGSRYNHACVMARVRELVPFIQVGIRSLSSDEIPFIVKERIFFAHDLYYNKDLYSEALSKLTNNVYITIDLDVFDPSLMPSTGTPEPGGPDYYELIHFLRDVIKGKNVVGFDIVELCPSSSNKAPDFIAAKIIYQLLSYIYDKL